MKHRCQLLSLAALFLLGVNHGIVKFLNSSLPEGAAK